MKLFILLIISIMAFAFICALDEFVIHLSPDGAISSWLPWIISLAVLICGLVKFRKDTPIKFLILGFTFSLVLVIAGDTAIAILFSCARGVCL